MKVTVDDEACSGHAVCCSLCPEVFTLSEDGYTVVRSPEVPTELEEVVRIAASRCPEHAITAS